MRVELICIGTELLTGKVNTNIAYIGARLNSIGLELSNEITVSDDKKEMEKVFIESFGRADVVIMTGGLGPTFDDLTREIASKVLRRKLIFDKDIMAQIARHFIDRNMEMPKNNESQAYIISGARVITNKTGTAPGQIIEVKSLKFKVKNIVLLPGPPAEINPMFENTVLPYLKSKYEQKIVKSKILHVYGLPESKVDELIKPIVKSENNVFFTILAHLSVIDIKITVSGTDEMLVDETLNKIKTEIYEILKENIFGEDNETLENIIGNLLIKRRKTLAVTESCTGGLLSHRITNIPGSSVYFRAGIVAYSNSEKISILNVDPETIEKYGAVSGETVLEMARGLQVISKADYVLAVSGIAGPGGGTAEKPVGLVYFGLATPTERLVEKMKFTGSRIEIKGKSVNYALDMLRRQLIGTHPI